MKKTNVFILLAVVLFTLFTSPSFCQGVTFNWAKTFGGVRGERCMAMVIDSNKYLFSTGMFSDLTDFDMGPGVFMLTPVGNGEDIYISKVDTAGNFIWVKQIGGNSPMWVNSMTKDSDGNFYLTGTFQDPVDFDPGPGVSTITPISGLNTFILKLDNNGNFIWVKRIVTPRLSTINAESPNEVLIGGSFYGTVDFDPGPGTYSASTGSAIIYDLYLLKLNSNGDFVWMKQFHANTQNASNLEAIRRDANKNILMTGYVSDIMDFDPGPATANFVAVGFSDVFILKLDPNGNYTWVKQLAGPDGEGPTEMDLDHAGNICITGTFKGTTDFDPGTAVYPLSSSGIYVSNFVSKLDNNGNFIFAKQFISSNSHVGATSMTLDWNDDIYLSGNYGGFTGTATDFDPGPGVYNLYDGSAFIAKLSSTGDFKWAKALMSLTGTYSTYISAIRTDILKNVYTSSVFLGTVDFDPDLPVYAVTATANDGDVYLQKMSQCYSLNNIAASSCSDYTLNGTTYTNSGIYYQTLLNAMGCDSIIALNLTILRTATQLNASVCQGAFYEGYGNTGVYIDTFTTVSGCDSVRTLNLTVSPLPLPDLGTDTKVCGSNSKTLTPGNFTSYLWNDGSIAPTLNVTLPGTYWVTVKNSNNCQASDTINVTTGVAPVVIAEKANDIDCISRTSLLSASGAQTYTWYPGTGLNDIYSPNPQASPLVTTMYILTGVTSDGCQGKDTVIVTVKAGGPGSELYMPNSFTPNGDGKNDCYGIKYTSTINDLVFMIYNRWGEKVFSTNNQSACWDGIFRGKNAIEGGYVFYLKGNTDCRPVELQGSFMLVR